MSKPHPPVSMAASNQPVPFIDLVAQYQTIRDEVREAVDRCFENQHFILGEEVTLLEQEIAQYCDARFAIGCASGTDALILALRHWALVPATKSSPARSHSSHRPVRSTESVRGRSW